MTTRGTTNGNQRGNTAARRARKIWMLTTFRANVDMAVFPSGIEVPVEIGAEMSGENAGARIEIACRCYRCGKALWFETLTVDRIIPGCRGGTYRRNNIRPACGPCNYETGGALRSDRKAK